MTSLTIYTDTFCATGCSYCGYSSKTVNKATYGFERLRNFCDFLRPNRIIPFGGDVYYDKKQIHNITDFICTLPYVKNVGIVSELPKLDRDIPLIAEVNKKLKNAGKNFSLQLSLDLEGPKADFSKIKYLDDLTKIFNNNSRLLTTVITTKSLMEESYKKPFKEMMEICDKTNSFIKIKFNFDYNAIYYRVEGLEAKTEEFLKTIYYTTHVIPFIADRKFGCRIGNSFTVAIDGTIDGCWHIKTGEIMANSTFSALDMTKETFEKLMKYQPKYKKEYTNKYCEKCEAKDYCFRCKKHIHVNKNFDGTQAVCQFYKTFEKVRNRADERPYKGFFKW